MVEQTSGPERIRRQRAEPLHPVVDPAEWYSGDVAASDDWMHAFSPGQIDEIDAAIAGVGARGLEIMDIRREDFPLPTLGPVLDGVRDTLLDGRGFAILRGLPVGRYSRLESAIAFWGIGAYLGEAVSQNAKGHLLGHVKDLVGEVMDSPRNRGYQSRSGLPYHGDSCDVVGLLCLHTAKSGGLSSIVSSPSIHNLMLQRRPDLVAELARPWYRDRRGEVPDGKKPWFELPVFNYYAGYLTTSMQGNYIRTAQRFPELPRFTKLQREALDMMEALEDELHIDIEFRPGDMQFLHNHVILHSRTAFEDYPEPERKRHLLRLWLSTPDGRPLPPAYAERYHSLAEGQRPVGGIIVPGTELKTPLEAE